MRPFSFSKDSKRIVTIQDDSVYVWEVDTARKVATLKGKPKIPFCKAEFSPDGRQILTATGDGWAQIWDIQKEKTLTTFLGGHSAGFSEDGQRVFTCSSNGVVRVYSRRRPEPWWGIAWLPEFWIALVSGVGLVAMAVRHLRSRRSS